MNRANGRLDLVVVGGGIAGAAMALVMARSGARVAMLERQTVYRDRVRREYMQPWGVAEAQRLSLCDVFEQAGGIYVRYNVPYDELRPPEAAESLRRDVTQFVPGVSGGLCAGHPASCSALSDAAESAGAEVVRGVSYVEVTCGTRPKVRFDVGGQEQRLACTLVIGADGRTSGIRAQAGIPLHKAPAAHLVCGLLVDGAPDWPRDTYSVGTEGDVMFFVFLQGDGQVRLYLCTALDQRDRFAGPDGPKRFLKTFQSMRSLPHAETIGAGTPIGPCATLGGEDSWTDDPFTDGVALIGDAAGYNDPIIGEGLALSMRDVRVLSDILLQDSDWSAEKLRPYAEERGERMRRMRFTASLMAALYSDFSPEAKERRRRFQSRMQDGTDRDLKFALAATSMGPDRIPSFAFKESMHAKVLQ